MKERFQLLGAALKHTLSFAGDLVILNLLVIFCSLPVFTIGAAATAGYAGVFRTLRKKETGLLIRAFFQDFRAAFRQATAGWLLQLLAVFLLAGDIWFAVVYSEPDNRFFLIFAIVLGAVLLLAGLWFYPLIARFQNPFGAQLKNAFLMAFAQFPRTLLALLVWVLILGLPAAFFDLFAYFGWFWLLCGVSLPIVLTAKLFRKTLLLEPAPEDAAGED
ncbi:MAG: DUF624 domain-containing protein [Clostridiales bacterium]|nr:DUF624 domain-containing protein [Clostridiales bacterium]